MSDHRNSTTASAVSMPTRNPNAIRAASFQAACDMEDPLTIIGDLLRMINIMCLAGDIIEDDRDRCALQRVGWLAGEQLKEAERLRGELFHMNHANPDGVEKREGV